MPAANDFDGAREPMRALRDLISLCEQTFHPGDDSDVLERAQAGFTSLRKLLGDKRLAEDVAFGPMIEPKMAPINAAPDLLEVLQMTSAALQCVAQLLPAGEVQAVKFTGKWSHLPSQTIAQILDRANDALEPKAEG